MFRLPDHCFQYKRCIYFVHDTYMYHIFILLLLFYIMNTLGFKPYSFTIVCPKPQIFVAFCRFLKFIFIVIKKNS